jgi:hypothetical protein
MLNLQHGRCRHDFDRTLLELQQRSAPDWDQCLTGLHELQKHAQTGSVPRRQLHPKPNGLAVKIKSALFRDSLKHGHPPG